MTVVNVFNFSVKSLNQTFSQRPPSEPGRGEAAMSIPAGASAAASHGAAVTEEAGKSAAVDSSPEEKAEPKGSEEPFPTPGATEDVSSASSVTDLTPEELPEPPRITRDFFLALTSALKLHRAARAREAAAMEKVRPLCSAN